MKKLILFITLSYLFTNAFGQEKAIKMVVIDEQGYNIEISYTAANNKITDNNLSVEIAPISPDELNDLFLIENTRNGKFYYTDYNSSRNSYFLKRNKKKSSESNYSLLRMGLDYLLGNTLIDEDNYNKFLTSIDDYYLSEQNEEDKSASVVANPYYLNNRYLNVFKVNIENSTSAPIVYKNNLLILTGNNSLYPISTEEIQRYLINENTFNNLKASTLERHNMPVEFIVPSNSKVEYYIATLPIDISLQDVTAYFPSSNKKITWQIKNSTSSFSEIYKYYEFDIKLWAFDRHQMNSIYFSLLKCNFGAVISEGNIFIPENNMNDLFEIFTITVINSKFYYGSIKLSGNELISTARNRRKDLRLPVEEIKIDG